MKVSRFFSKWKKVSESKREKKNMTRFTSKSERKELNCNRKKKEEEETSPERRLMMLSSFQAWSGPVHVGFSQK